MPTRTCKGTPARSSASAPPRPGKARPGRRVRRHARGPGDSRNRPVPVAHVPGDETAGSRDEIGAAAVVRADDLTHVLGVEPGRERGRANEVAEHDGELTALGGVQRARRGISAVVTCRCALLNGFEIGNRCQQFPPMAEQDAKLSPDLEVSSGGRLVDPLSRNVCAYCSRPIPRSQPSMSKLSPSSSCHRRKAYANSNLV